MSKVGHEVTFERVADASGLVVGLGRITLRVYSPLAVKNRISMGYLTFIY